MNPSKIISNDLIAELLPLARSNARKRMNYNIHGSYDEQVQRFLNVISYDSYVRPHYHVQEDSWEGFIIIEGELSVLQFDHSGAIIESNILSSKGSKYGIELDATQPHCITSISPHSIVFEYKQGPYRPDNDKAFPQWAPTEEHTAQSNSYHQWLKTACVGDQFNN